MTSDTSPFPVSLKSRLYSLPLLGVILKTLAIILRLPVRMQQIYEELGSLRALYQNHVNEVNINYARSAAVIQEMKHMTQKYFESASAELSAQKKRLNEISNPTQSPRSEAEDTAVDLLQADIDEMYYKFEERFRGSEGDIKRKLQSYRPFIDNLAAKNLSGPILDIGCGRGEWLELLRDWGRLGQGIDINTKMVEVSKAKGLNAHVSDALAHLGALPSSSLAGVTGFHIVEHLPTTTMLRIFRECFRVIKPGGLVIFETPNPENIIVGTCDFYTDPTHRNPIPPSSLRFFIELAGFSMLECLRLSPNDWADTENLSDPLRRIVERFKVGPDYAIIGFKMFSL